MLFVFTTDLSRKQRAEEDADAVAAALGITAYEMRLALAPGAPSVVLVTNDAKEASNAVAVLRARGHGAQAFDDEALVPCEKMGRFDHFVFEAEGVRRTADGELLGYGDVFAILTAVHDHAKTVSTTRKRRLERLGRWHDPEQTIANSYQRERVAYFFRRSGGKPWILREWHASYLGLGAERGPTAHANFMTTRDRFQRSAPFAVSDDRLLRRRLGQRLIGAETGSVTERSSQAGMDLLAHLLAATIANQGGSPYR